MASNPKSDAKEQAPAPSATQDPKANSKDLAGEVETGGLSSFRQPDHVIGAVVAKVEEAIKAEINGLQKQKDGRPLKQEDRLEVVGYRLNIVNGYLYFAKISMAGGSFVQARILQTPKGDVTLQSVTETKTEADEREYFKLPPTHK